MEKNKVTASQLIRVYESLYPNNNPSRYGALINPMTGDYIQTNKILATDNQLMEMITELKYELIDMKSDENVMPLSHGDNTVI